MKQLTDLSKTFEQSGALDSFLDLLLIISAISREAYDHATDHLYGDKRKNSKIYRSWKFSK